MPTSSMTTFRPLETAATLKQILAQILHEHVPDGDDMTDGTGEDEEMEHGMHVFLLIERIEHSTRDVADALGNNPDEGRR